MITFPKSININACEKTLAMLHKTKADEELKLPVDTSQYAFGGLAAAIQVINTWGRKSKNRILIIRKINPIGEEYTKEDCTKIAKEATYSAWEGQISELIKRPHKLTAIMFARKIAFDHLPEIDIRNTINLEAKIAVEEQAKSLHGQQHGGLCWFAFVDHSTKGFDKNFYRETEPRQPAHIREIIRAMVDRSSATQSTKKIDGEILDYLGRIFYELFLNTHEHGSRGQKRSEWIKPGIRLIYTNAINLTDTGKENALKDEPVLKNYLASTAINSKNHRFIEISIIDSGLGYCKRWQADHPAFDFDEKLPLNKEYEILKTCFLFRRSSTSIDTKGHGLPVVLDRLTKLKGFIRIRSGRLALFRNFIVSPFTDSESESCEFTDWVTQKNAHNYLTEMPEVIGTAITFLIPLETIS